MPSRRHRCQRAEDRRRHRDELRHPNARYLTREVLTTRRMPAVRNISPDLTRTYATLTHHGRGVVVSMACCRRASPRCGRVPGGVRERRRRDGGASSPKPKGLRRPRFHPDHEKIDGFTPQIDSTETWAEWHYFNYHDDAGRSLYVSLNARVRRRHRGRVIRP